MAKSLLFLLLLFAVFGCSDLTFLADGNVYMPLKIVGNSTSGILILIVHGGPGSGSIMYYSYDNNFGSIEARHRVAYWDQRLAGISQGNARTEDLTLGNLASDLHKAVQLLRHLEKPRRIVIAAHSFGGMLSLQYLASYGAKDSIAGLIYINGLHNTPLAYSSSIRKVREFANRKIDSNEDASYWKDALNYYLEIDTTRLLKYGKHYEYVMKSKGVHYEVPIRYVTAGKFFFSEAAGFDNLLNSMVSLRNAGDDILRADFSDVLPSIALPLLVVWGEHDGVVPLSSAYDIAEKIGTPDSLKRLVILDRSAHEPFIEQRIEFAEAVNRFVEGL